MRAKVVCVRLCRAGRLKIGDGWERVTCVGWVGGWVHSGGMASSRLRQRLAPAMAVWHGWHCGSCPQAATAVAAAATEPGAPKVGSAASMN